MTNHHEFRLAEGITALSVANEWSLARAEWDLHEVYFSEEPDTCLCSHFPIIEVCVLRNRNNGNLAEVGNVCVNRFLGLPSKIIFDGIKRVSKDREKALNDSAAHHAFRSGWVNEWEYQFLINTARQRDLSAKQLNKRMQINERVLLKMKRS